MPEQRIYELMDELDVLLEEKVQDEENRELLEAYHQFEGVTDEQLDAFEHEHGIRLPADFRAFYKRKNGSGYGFHVLYPSLEEGRETEPFYLMSLERIQRGNPRWWRTAWMIILPKKRSENLIPESNPTFFRKNGLRLACSAVDHCI